MVLGVWLSAFFGAQLPLARRWPGLVAAVMTLLPALTVSPVPGHTQPESLRSSNQFSMAIFYGRRAAEVVRGPFWRF